MRAAGLEPLEPYPGSSKQWRCRCLSCNTNVFPRYGNIAQGNGGCRTCGYIKSTAKTRTPQDVAIKEMKSFGYQPTEQFTSVNLPWKSIHDVCGREVSPTIGQLRRGKGGCGYCALKRVDIEEAIQFMKSKNLEPIADYPGSKKHWQCRCLKCGGICSPAYGQLKTGKQKSGCWRCALNNNWKDLNSEQREARIKAMSERDFHAEEALAGITALNLVPLEPFRSLQSKWKCLCLNCNREVAPSYEQIKSGKQKSGCAYCAGQKVDELEAVDFMMSRSLQPLEPFPGSGSQWKCKCLKCERDVLPRYGNIKSGWGGCAWCTGQKIDPDVAVLAMQSAGLEPLEPYPGTQKPWKCRCTKCNREVSPMHLTVAQGQGGCKYCAVPGLNWQDEAFLYLLVGRHFMKVGIANSKTLETRLRKHKKWGLEVVSLWEFNTGEDAHKIEQSVIKWWRNDLKAAPVPRAYLPDGWTETVSIYDVEVEDAVNFIISQTEF